MAACALYGEYDDVASVGLLGSSCQYRCLLLRKKSAKRNASGPRSPTPKFAGSENSGNRIPAARLLSPSVCADDAVQTAIGRPCQTSFSSSRRDAVTSLPVNTSRHRVGASPGTSIYVSAQSNVRIRLSLEDMAAPRWRGTAAINQFSPS